MLFDFLMMLAFSKKAKEKKEKELKKQAKQTPQRVYFFEKKIHPGDWFGGSLGWIHAVKEVQRYYALKFKCLHINLHINSPCDFTYGFI